MMEVVGWITVGAGMFCAVGGAASALIAVQEDNEPGVAIIAAMCGVVMIFAGAMLT